MPSGLTHVEAKLAVYKTRVLPAVLFTPALGYVVLGRLILIPINLYFFKRKIESRVSHMRNVFFRGATSLGPINFGPKNLKYKLLITKYYISNK